jgi:hypothetical protein
MAGPMSLKRGTKRESLLTHRGVINPLIWRLGILARHITYRKPTGVLLSGQLYTHPGYYITQSMKSGGACKDNAWSEWQRWSART